MTDEDGGGAREARIGEGQSYWGGAEAVAGRRG